MDAWPQIARCLTRQWAGLDEAERGDWIRRWESGTPFAHHHIEHRVLWRVVFEYESGLLGTGPVLLSVKAG